jgi:hypothetical protein
MPACTRMFARMTIRRAVAAQRFAALLARAQMDPGRADLYALFTFQTLRMFDILDCVQMRTASVVHELFGIVVVGCCQPDVNSGDGHSAFADSRGATLH